MRRRQMICQLPKEVPAPPRKVESRYRETSYNPHTYMHHTVQFVLSGQEKIKHFFQAKSKAKLPYLWKIRNFSIKMESSAIECYWKVSACVQSHLFREGICRWHSHFLNKPLEKSEIAEGKFVPKPFVEHSVWKISFEFILYGSLLLEASLRSKYSHTKCKKIHGSPCVSLYVYEFFLVLEFMYDTDFFIRRTMLTDFCPIRSLKCNLRAMRSLMMESWDKGFFLEMVKTFRHHSFAKRWLKVYVVFWKIDLYGNSWYCRDIRMGRIVSSSRTQAPSKINFTIDQNLHETNK